MIENKQVKNKITFYLDKVPENLKDSVLTTYCETCEAIHSGMIYLNRVPYDYDGENWKTYNGTDWVTCDTPNVFN